MARNDGSDMRVRKEVISLSKFFEDNQIYVILLHSALEHPLGKELSNVTYLRVGKLLQRFKFGKLFLPFSFLLRAGTVLFTKSVRSVHVVNDEMFLTILLCRLIKTHVVLDVFDSYELKFSERKGLLGFILRWVSRVAKLNANKVIVTDFWRRNLLDEKVIEKAVILPNYPSIASLPRISDLGLSFGKHSNSIFFGGSLFKSRGIDTIIEFLSKSPNMRVQCAGWVLDEAAQELIDHPQVDYHGVLSQEMSNKLCGECLASVALYEPKNLNNIYASPNKIYDSLCLGEYVFINSETKLSSWIGRSKLVKVFSYFDSGGLVRSCNEVIKQKNMKKIRRYAKLYRRLFIWENFERVLYDVHNRSISNQ